MSVTVAALCVSCRDRAQYHCQSKKNSQKSFHRTFSLSEAGAPGAIAPGIFSKFYIACA